MMDESEPEKPKIQFKSIKKKRPIRQKDSSDEEESIEAVDKDAFEEILEIQKLRKRSKGVSAVTLYSNFLAVRIAFTDAGRVLKLI